MKRKISAVYTILRVMGKVGNNECRVRSSQISNSNVAVGGDTHAPLLLTFISKRITIGKSRKEPSEDLEAFGLMKKGPSTNKNNQRSHNARQKHVANASVSLWVNTSFAGSKANMPAVIVSGRGTWLATGSTNGLWKRSDLYHLF